MRRTRPSGGGGPGQPGETAAARVRRAGEDFSASFAQLKAAVSEACTGGEDWEARVAAGIRAVLEFAAESPGAARALTVQARGGDSKVDREREVIAHFAELLGKVAPCEERFGVSTDRGVVESIATVIRAHVLAGTTDRLPEAAPDLVYLALMPYLGLAGTRRWANSVGQLRRG